jgi:HK97 family phage major capsid protein
MHTNPEAMLRGALELSGDTSAIELKSADDDAPEQIVTKALADLTANVNAKLAEIEQKAADQNKLGQRLDTIEKALNRPATGAASIESGDQTEERKSFVNYLRTGVVEQKALAFGAPSTGGVLAPQEFSKTVLEKALEFSPVRQIASSITISGPMISLPRLVDEVEPASVTETGTRAEDEPSFEQIDLKPFEMAVIVPVTRVLLEDAHINLEAYLGDHIARRFGKKESTAFVNGNGTTAAEGVLTSTEVGQLVAADDVNLTADELIDLFYSVKSAYSANGSWLMNRATMAKVRKLKDTDGSYIWQPSIAAGQPATLMGRPVLEAVDMPNAAAGTTPIVFGDFAAGYVIVDHVAFTTLRDEFTGASTGLIKLHARRRVGGRVVLGEALTKLTTAAS